MFYYIFDVSRQLFDVPRRLFDVSRRLSDKRDKQIRLSNQHAHARRARKHKNKHAWRPTLKTRAKTRVFVPLTRDAQRIMAARQSLIMIVRQSSIMSVF